MRTGSPWRIRWGDLVVAGSLVALGIGGVGWGRTAPAGRNVMIRGKHGTSRLPLDGKGYQEMEILGPLGTTKVRVGKGSARIVSSPCPERICEKMGAISAAGDWVACIPNGVVLRIEAGRELDGVTR